jgi:hypothetical protein
MRARNQSRIPTCATRRTLARDGRHLDAVDERLSEEQRRIIVSFGSSLTRGERSPLQQGIMQLSLAKGWDALPRGHGDAP